MKLDNRRWTEDELEIMRAAGSLMGSRRSERKARSSRANGRLGGKPRLFVQCASGKPHRWRHGRCRFCGHPKSALKVKAVKAAK